MLCCQFGSFVFFWLLLVRSHRSPLCFFFFLMIRRPPRSTQGVSSAASDVYKRQVSTQSTWGLLGTPGSGKTVVAEYLRDKYGFELYDLRQKFNETRTKPLDTESLLMEFSSKANEDCVFKLFEAGFMKGFQDFRTKTLIFPVTTERQMAKLRSKKSVFIIGVNAPILFRHKIFCKKYFQIPFKGFLEYDDAVGYALGPSASEIQRVFPYCSCLLQNKGELKDFIDYIGSIDFANQDLLRPCWDTYFLQVAELVARRSNCMKCRVGTVLVKDLRVISTGYAGTAPGFPNCYEGECKHCINPKEVPSADCVCLHAEQNSVFETGRYKTTGSCLYTTNFPCLLCTKSIIQAGIKRLVYFRDTPGEFSLELLKTAKVTVLHHSPYTVSEHLIL
eukprot:TRINITY_DN2533_c0_g1_i1.p1 TRINITY_DN2533_c0_g1~~TRINITY_DN2533_c0_g1_i1.p1  ORF type:complete len:390 (+),score=39.82 TRINITY_DN2533_c0_g1_i1:25-1194(+)